MKNQVLVIKSNPNGRALLPPNNTHTNRMEIRSSSSDKLYVVSQRVTAGPMYGRWECSCPGWVGHNHGRYDYRCQHLKNMVPLLESAARTSTFPKRGR